MVKKNILNKIRRAGEIIIYYIVGLIGFSIPMCILFFIFNIVNMILGKWIFVLVALVMTAPLICFMGIAIINLIMAICDGE